MKKLLLLFIVTLFSLNNYAQTIEVKYDITYGSLLDLGVATSTLNVEEDNYSILMKAKTIGISKILTNNRIEIYESHGKIVNNQFFPKKFIKTKKDNNKIRVRTFTFKHQEKKILVHDIKKGNEKILNDELKQESRKFHHEITYDLDYYADNDILSLFFNLRKKLPKFKKGNEYTLNAVGANKTKGLINILMPSKKDLDKINNYLKTDDKSKFIAYINQKIFQSKRGELLISLNKEGFCSYAVLKDVLFFGDIVGKMVDFKIKN